MTDEQLLAMTKCNLALTSTTWDTYLANLITVARQSIEREGINLGSSLEDDNLIVMYASYLYRKRTEDNPGMPRMLRYALNNRLLSEKAGAE